MNRKSLLCGALLLLPFAVGVAGSTSQRAFANPIDHAARRRSTVQPSRTTGRRSPRSSCRPSSRSTTFPAERSSTAPTGRRPLFGDGREAARRSGLERTSPRASSVRRRGTGCTFRPARRHGGNASSVDHGQDSPWFEGADGGIQVTFGAGGVGLRLRPGIRHSGRDGHASRTEPYLIAYGANGCTPRRVLYPLVPTDPNFADVPDDRRSPTMRARHQAITIRVPPAQAGAVAASAGAEVRTIYSFPK